LNLLWRLRLARSIERPKMVKQRGG
jgi:hypothetical protein